MSIKDVARLTILFTLQAAVLIFIQELFYKHGLEINMVVLVSLIFISGAIGIFLVHKWFIKSYEVKLKQNHDNHTQLIDQMQFKNLMLERNNRITASIMDITTNILSSGDASRVLQMILDRAIEIIPNAQKGSILLLNGNDLEFAAVRGYEKELIDKVKLNYEETYQYRLNIYDEPAIIRDVEAFDRATMSIEKYNELKKQGAFDLKSTLTCAIMLDEEYLGLINIDNAEQIDAFNEGDEMLIKHLADQIGIALKKAKLIEQVLYMSRHDALTGVCNRCFFEELYDEKLFEVKNNGETLSIVIFDLNDLKQINDMYGHDAGDKLLAHFADVFKKNIRDNDIFARIGGDEFALLLIGADDVKADKFVQRMINIFEESPLYFDGISTCVGFAYGIASYPKEDIDNKALMKKADMRMYEKKREMKAG